MTNYERIMAAMTPENYATDMMCPYDGSDEGMPCLEDFSLRGNCVKSCYDWLMKETEEDAEVQDMRKGCQSGRGYT